MALLRRHRLVAVGGLDGARDEDRAEEPGELATHAATSNSVPCGVSPVGHAQISRSSPGLERLTLHEARHTYASLMIAAGVAPKTLQTVMGHASIAITFDRYGHLFPGDEQAAADALQALLELHVD